MKIKPLIIITLLFVLSLHLANASELTLNVVDTDAKQLSNLYVTVVIHDKKTDKITTSNTFLFDKMKMSIPSGEYEIELRDIH